MFYHLSWSPRFESNLVPYSKLKMHFIYNDIIIVLAHFHSGTPHQVISTFKPFNRINSSFQIARYGVPEWFDVGIFN